MFHVLELSKIIEHLYFKSCYYCIWFPQHKKMCACLQKKSNTSAYQNRCVLRLILYHVCVNLPVMIFSYPAFKFMGLRSSLPLPHW